MLGTVPENKTTSGITADHELRQRIDSLSAQLKAGRSCSFGSENYDIHGRTESVGTGAARRPSFIKGQKEVWPDINIIIAILYYHNRNQKINKQQM
jgi:hypothetical protein